ncbi:MAG: ABC transporter ATP-binding protein [Candidatus Tantalella remota]|nr:ABC transporter ATP-binding protein [Candidatus Tantalella remota]
MEPILIINNLIVTIAGRRVIDDVSLELYPGRVTAIVGESGSGKTLTALSVLDLLPETAKVVSGEVIFDGKDVFKLREDEKRKIRGFDIGMVFQEPFTALNPVMKVGDQVGEVLLAHNIIKKKELKPKVRELFEQVKLSPNVADSYPHELSGGMRQRAVIAMAMACDPRVLILDEPTTALDVSIQEEVLALVSSIQKKNNLSILFITHDFSIVNMLANEVCVMKEGIIVEKGSREDVLRSPQNEYTKKLIDCIPRIGDKRDRLPG